MTREEAFEAMMEIVAGLQREGVLDYEQAVGVLRAATAYGSACATEAHVRTYETMRTPGKLPGLRTRLAEAQPLRSGWYISDQHGGEYIENAVYETKAEAIEAAQALGPQPRRDVIVGNYAASGEVERVHEGVFETMRTRAA